jgi:hypothetical protein
VENINWRKEIAFAGVATIVAFIVAATCAATAPAGG